MPNLVFKTADAAIEYIEKFFVVPKLRDEEHCYGVIRFVDEDRSPTVYGVEVAVLQGHIFRKTARKLLGAVSDLNTLPLGEGDLVGVVVLNSRLDIPAGVIMQKYKLEIDEFGRFVEWPARKEPRSQPQTSHTKAVPTGMELAWYELNHKYGLVLRNLEFREDQEKVYVTYSKDNVICASFAKDSRRWSADNELASFQTLPLISNSSFEEIVFEPDIDAFTCRLQFVEFCLFGLPEGKIKNLWISIDGVDKHQLQLEAHEWNLVLLGEEVKWERLYLTNFPLKDKTKSGLDSFRLTALFNSTREGLKSPHFCDVFLRQTNSPEVEATIYSGGIKELRGYY